MKLIGLDVGTVRIGVAKADSKVKIAVPAGMIPVDGGEFDAIARLARVYGANCFVIGLPRNVNGEETKQSAAVRQFADTLKAKIPGASITFQDETLTSVLAEERLNKSFKSPKSAKKQRKSGIVDAEAAVIILQDFLEQFVEKSGGKLPKEAKKHTSRALGRVSAKQRRKWPIILIFALLFVLGGVLGLISAYFASLEPPYTANACETPNDPSECVCGQSVTLEIPDGASTATIASRLEGAGLIRSALTFQIFSKLGNLDGTYKSGEYHLTKCLSVHQIAERLQAGTAATNVFRFTILPGETIASVRAKLEKQGYSAEEISAAFAKTYDHPVLAGKPADQGLEGYLYGETYEFFVGESVENIIKKTLDQLYQVVKENDLEAAYKAQGLNLYQGIILASIVQKEAKSADMPGVARVFLNRLSRGISLGSDVTTKYSLDLVDPDRQTYTNNQAALKIAECHNTRLYAGLPCGPISMPGKTALLAVAHPAESDNLFFLTGDDGLMYYSNTESGHQKNIRDHCRELCKAQL